eukprot:755266-Hanusia_phi.AAC.1
MSGSRSHRPPHPQVDPHPHSYRPPLPTHPSISTRTTPMELNSVDKAPVLRLPLPQPEGGSEASRSLQQQG